MDPTPLASRAALLAGATGLIGRALLRALLQSQRYSTVHVLVRRTVSGIEQHPAVQIHVIDFTRLPEALPKADDVYIALGTTISEAGSEAAFRKVDFDFVVDTARAARLAGAKRLAVVSALGADTQSRVFYNRVKGDMQDAASRLGYESLVIVQPSLLLGDRAALGQPVRKGEIWATALLRPVMQLVPKGIRPIRAETVARAMLDAMLHAQPGVRILSSAHMHSAAPR